MDGVDPWRSGNVRGVEPFKLDIYEWEGGHRHHPIIVAPFNDDDRASFLSSYSRPWSLRRRAVIFIVRRGGALSRRRELERSHDEVVGDPFVSLCEQNLTRLERMPKIATLPQRRDCFHRFLSFSLFDFRKFSSFFSLFFGLFFPRLLHFFFPKAAKRTHQTHTKDTYNQPCGKYFHHSFSFHSVREKTRVTMQRKRAHS